MTRFAIVHAETTVIAHTGRGVPILPGRYEVVEIDGAAERGVMYVVSTAGTLVCMDLLNRHVSIEEGGLTAACEVGRCGSCWSDGCACNCHPEG